MSIVRIATRASALARWQAEHVAGLLVAAVADLEIEVVPLSTEGDRRTDLPLSEIGGKGVFATEVQQALLDGRADIAVHSAKDLPAATPSELVIAAIPQRGDARDALVGGTLADLREGAMVATGSARRRALLADLRPDLEFAELRGNMATRLSKAADFDAIVVAGVALERLGLAEQIDDWLDTETFVPQVAQAALAVECRAGDSDTRGLLGLIDDAESRRRVMAERDFLVELGGDCSLPAGAHAVIGDSGELVLRAVLADSPGGHLVRGQLSSVESVNPGGELAIKLRALLG
ncbi:MAG: hydroxymethylbilane synthase [Microthrixaceae bacterium]|nr:hydroxymethylbilane synthase [Microthrixaceae bacterium]